MENIFGLNTALPPFVFNLLTITCWIGLVLLIGFFLTILIIGVKNFFDEHFFN
jgi:hypothetical protein